MGTMLAAEILCARPDSCEPAFRLIAAALQKVDTLMSVYHDSEVTRLNTAAGQTQYLQPVSDDTEQVLRAALHVATRSAGAFDITIKPLADLYGFYRKDSATNAGLPTQAEVVRAQALVGYRGLVVESRSAGLRRKGMQIDLGGIAKGFALDQAAASLTRAGYKEFTLNFGGQILAHGVKTGIVVRHPNSERTLLRCDISFGSVSVSAQSERFRIAGGNRIGHLLNPHTGSGEATNVVSMVFHDQAMLADAWSTALFFADAAEFSRITASEYLRAYRLPARGEPQYSAAMLKGLECRPQ